MSMFTLISAFFSMFLNFSEKHLKNFVFVKFFIYNQHFLPFGRVDNTPSALLRRICGTKVQLHTSTPRICGILDS